MGKLFCHHTNRGVIEAALLLQKGNGVTGTKTQGPLIGFLAGIRLVKKTSACLRGEGFPHLPMVQRSQYIRIKNPLHKHFARMPMAGG